MSRAQSLHSKENFIQTFKYDEKRAPHGISLEEFLRSCAYIESSPITFSSLPCSGPQNVTLENQYNSYVEFCNADANKSRPALKTVLFPLFCHVVIALRKQKDEARVKSFVATYVRTIPDKLAAEAHSFANKGDTYEKDSCKFATQNYIVKMDFETAKVLNEFVNKRQNAELRSLLADIITIDPVWKETDDKPTIQRFQNSGSLSIVQCRVKNATCAEVSNDFSGIYAAIDDTDVYKIDPSSSERTRLYNHSSIITTMSLSSEGKVLMTGDLDGTINIWSEGCHPIHRSIGSSIWCSAFAPRGGIFATGSSDAIVGVYDVRKGQQCRMCVGHTSPVTSVEFYPNCSLLGSFSNEERCNASTVRIWSLREASTVRLFTGRETRNSPLAFSHDGKLAFFDGSIRICDIGENKVITKHPIDKDIAYLSFSEDNQFLYAVTTNGEVASLAFKETDASFTEIAGPRGHVITCRMNRPNELRLITSN